MLNFPRPAGVFTGQCSAVSNMSGNRWESDCISMGPEFNPGPVPYFRGDWSWNNFLRSFSSLPLNHSRRVVVSYKWKYMHEVLVNCILSCPGKSVVRWTDRPAITIAVDLGRKATKQTNCRRFRLQSLGQWDGGVVGRALDWGSMGC